MSQWVTATVVEHKNWHADLFSLRVQAPPFDFIAGQFVRLGLQDEEGHRIQRAYSLVNPPHESTLDFVITRVPDGLLSPKLQQLQVGDELQLSQYASGFFTIGQVPDGDSLWLLSTGTGVGPFLSMLHTQEPWQRFQQIKLIHAVRTEADLCYRDDFLALQDKYGEQFHYQPVVSREPVTGALPGRIPALIDSGELEQACHGTLNASAQVMICGNPAMIKDARESLSAKGLEKNLKRKPGNVTVEQYWK